MKLFEFIKIGSFTVIALLLMLGITYTSCDKTDIDEAVSDTPQNYPFSVEDARKEARASKVTIENLTLRDLNTLLVANNLPEYVPSGDYNPHKRSCPSPFNCPNLQELCWLGDYNHDNKLNGLDLIQLQQHCNSYCVEYYPTDYRIFKAALASDVVNGSEGEFFSYDDIDIFVDAILCRSYICTGG